MEVDRTDLIRLVQAHLGRADVAESHRLIEDLEAESMDLVNVIADIEDRYDIVVDDGELAEVSTVGDLCDVVGRIAAREPG